MPSRAVLLPFLLVLVGAPAPARDARLPSPGPVDTSAAVQTWLRAHAVPLHVEPGVRPASVRPIEDVVGRARVIALGEPSHGIHEFLALRNWLFESLVVHSGVTAYAAETGYTESEAVEDCIAGRRAPTDSVAAAMFSWSAPELLPENRALLEWMREYNRGRPAEKRLHFLGIDLTGGRAGRFPEAPLAIERALDYLRFVDPAAGRELGSRLTGFLPRFRSGDYDSLAASQRDALTAALADLESLFERRGPHWSARTSRDSFDRALRQVVVARQLDANFRSAAAESNPQAQREAAMASNLEWALARLGPDARVFLFAANWHASRGPMLSDRWGSSLGESLASALGADYASIATTFGDRTGGDAGNAGAKPDSASFAAMMTRTQMPLCLLRLNDLPHAGPVAAWFHEPRPVRAGRIDTMVIGDAFDALIDEPSVGGGE